MFTIYVVNNMSYSISVADPSSGRLSARPQKSTASARAPSPKKHSEFVSSGFRELNRARLEVLRLSKLEAKIDRGDWLSPYDWIATTVYRGF